MIQSGFALKQKSDDTQLDEWYAVPNPINLPNGDQVWGADETWSNDEFEVVVVKWEVPDPEPVRKSLGKSVILARLTDAQLTNALSIMSQRQKEKWRAPDKPYVYIDDPELVAVLGAIGADANTVLADL